MDCEIGQSYRICHINMEPRQDGSNIDDIIELKMITATYHITSIYWKIIDNVSNKIINSDNITNTRGYIITSIKLSKYKILYIILCSTISMVRDERTIHMTNDRRRELCICKKTAIPSVWNRYEVKVMFNP